MIADVKLGWKKLSDILNTVIIKNINLQKPIKGDGISLSETASGTIISVLRRDQNDANQNQDQTQNQVRGTLQLVTLFDANGNPVVLNVWTDGNAPSASSLKWQSVDTVDPSTCAAGSITVLTQPK